ncbi:MAG: orotate phosphoribosyltransferase [Eubacterium sp.]
MNNIYTITSPRNDRVFIHAMPGHFISSNNHINYYIGTSDVKHNHEVSVDAAMLLAEFYNTSDIKVDTVLCLYETQALGAYLAHELARPNMLSPNPDQNVFVVGSEYDAAGNLIFRDNLRRMINGKNVVVLISCITSGRTVERAMESVQYYGGNVVGISSVFSAQDSIDGIKVNTIFNTDDIPGYASYPAHDCPLCRQGTPVDAISNGYGYSKL